MLERLRKILTSNQTKALEERFQAQPYPTPEKQHQIAKELSMSYKCVRIWFNNRRSKLKKYGVRCEGENSLVRYWHSHTNTHIHMHAHTYANTHRHVCTHTHTQTHTWTHKHTHGLIHKRTQTNTHRNTLQHALIQAQIVQYKATTAHTHTGVDSGCIKRESWL